MKYFARGRTRVIIVDAIATLAAPTLAEIAAGTEISEDLWSCSIRPITTTVVRTKWRGNVEAVSPARYGAEISLGGYRHVMATDEVLWPLAATFRATTHLVIRRGAPNVIPFAAGQLVEVYKARWGRRLTADVSGIGANPSVFEVPMFPFEIEDEATVAA